MAELIEGYDVAAVCAAVFDVARGEQWRGHDKHDILNSPALWALVGRSRVLRLFALQAGMRSPLDLRPLLRVPKIHNPKGLALLIQAAVRLRAQPGHDYAAVARELAALLGTLRRPCRAGSGWGYGYPWQDLGFFAPAHTPNAVVTSFVCEALLDLHALDPDPQRLQWVDDAIAFYTTCLERLVDEPDRLCVSYMPLPMRMRVMDVSILVASVLARRARIDGDPTHARTAERLVQYVVGCQTAEGAWYYTDPPQASPVKIDNYHTGFILDALARYMDATGDRRWDAAYARGLDFYERFLFEADGAPRWMSDRKFPHDVHGAAQGILTFARHPDRRATAVRIAGWTLRNLYDGHGRFYYRRNRAGVDRRFFLRWNNGWMVRALAELVHPSHSATPGAS